MQQIITKEILFQNQELTLTNERTIYWPSQSILILSDLHLGKASFFRKNGIPIPNSVQDVDVERLNNLINHFQPKSVVFVGDLFHAEANQELSNFQKISDKNPDTKFTLILGNHDQITQKSWNNFGISDITDKLQIANIHFIHQSNESLDKQAVICGHLHPGVRIKLLNRELKRLPCFVVSESEIILPAFSLFTGLDTRITRENASFYAFDRYHFYTV